MSGWRHAGGDGRRWTRRRLLSSTLCATLVSATGVLSAGPGVADEDRILRFGLTPVFLNNDLELLAALQAYLSQSTGKTIQLVTRRTYQEVTALLVSGELDAAWICGYPFVKFRDELDLVAVPDWNGKPLYQSYLIVGSDREVDGVGGLRGDIHAFSDPDSNSGYLVTQALLHDLGYTPNRFFRDAMFTYSHRNVIRAVASRLAQSGSVDGYVWEVMREIEPNLVNRTRILRKSEWLGFPPIAAGKRVSGSEKIAALSNALLSMHSTAAGREVLHMLRLTGFSQPGVEIFDTIAAKVDALRGVL